MKQINKANQLLSEKIGGVKGTEFEGEFHMMEKRTDVIYHLIDDIRDRTNEYLQPNPASRSKMWIANNASKLRGQVKNTPYPQPEGVLGESMIKSGKDLGEESMFGLALVDMGESMRQMAGIKYALEDNIKQNFLDPMHQIKETELKEVLHLRKKTESRRLDFDCKKRKKSAGSAVSEDEVTQAAEKFEESRVQTEAAMHHLLNNETEQLSHLLGFAEGLVEYHSQCTEILKDMVKQLNEKKKRVAVMAKSVEATGGRKPLSFGTAAGQEPFNQGTSSMFPNSNNGMGADSTSTVSDSNFNSNNSYRSPAANAKIENEKQSQQEQSGGGTKIMSSLNGFADSMGIKLPTYGTTSASGSNSSASGSSSTQKDPKCRALYDFDAENAEELDFKEGNMIKLIAKLDENWLQGELNGKQGRFPVSYVEIVNPI